MDGVDQNFPPLAFICAQVFANLETATANWVISVSTQLFFMHSYEASYSPITVELVTSGSGVAHRHSKSTVSLEYQTRSAYYGSV